MDGYLKVGELERGAAYEVDARNFSVAIWDGEAFQGLRFKMGEYYMFPEYHWDTHDFYGTVKPIRKLT